jgi:multidrug efflux system membrane fusion protein
VSAGRRSRWPWLIAAAIVVSGGVIYSQVHAQNAAAPARNRQTTGALPVVGARAQVSDVGVYLTGLGTVTAITTVTVRTRVDGELVKVAFKEGQLVHERGVLAEIDPRPFQVQLAQAESQAAKDASALNNARVDLRRYQALIAQDAVPKQQLDTQVATVQQLESTVKSDQAQIASAKLNLTYAHIESPATGRIGLRLVDPGNIVHASDQNGLAIITQRQPIAVVFTIAQDRLPDVLAQLRAGKSLPVDAFDREIKTRLGSGQLTAVDSQIDPSTGTIKLKATFPNDPETLFPNQFVNARLQVDTIAHAIVIPAAAVQRGPQNTFVYVVSGNGTVQSRTVAVAFDENDQSVVTRGLSANEIVVTDGADRLQPGSHVSVKVADQESPHTP